jgi:hypothetical protein
MSRLIDVCNGDADGLCATVQWRLHDPRPATLLTGLKRDIALLQRVQASAGDEVNVFDVSMQRNRAALLPLLDAGVHVRYFDHHAAGEPIAHACLEAHIDTASAQCTSLLVDAALQGAHRRWALVGAYGDNLTELADQLAQASGIPPDDRMRLRQLGEAINYNAYGDTVQDVLIAPAQLYPIMVRYADPLGFMAREGGVAQIEVQRQADLAQAMAWPPMVQSPQASVLVLPDAPWARRVQGCLANELANAYPQRAHAVLMQRASGEHLASVRAPLAHAVGADALCQAFGGSGRARAAGIDRLPPAQMQAFVAAFMAMAWGADSGR